VAEVVFHLDQRELLRRQRLAFELRQVPQVGRESGGADHARPAVASAESEDAEGGQIAAAFLAPEIQEAYGSPVTTAAKDDAGVLFDQLANVTACLVEVVAHEDGGVRQGMPERADDGGCDLAGAPVQQDRDGSSRSRRP
jgi:hypothetical protein